MGENPFHRAIYVTGPTASGKTAVALVLAQRLNAEIIALDSMTLYRGMDIGTAKPRADERALVTHHLLDVLDPWQSSSVAHYRGWAARAVEEIESRGRLPLFVGGTPMYLKVLLRGLFEGPPSNPELRRRLIEEGDRIGDDALHARLALVDARTASRLHPNDRRRVIRALEVFELTGTPLSTCQAEHDRPAPATVQVFALEHPRARLHERINDRVDEMLAAGWIDEVRRLLDLPLPLDPVPAQAVGYRELIAHLEDPSASSFSSTIEHIKMRTRQFAKRQSTWFRGLSEIQFWPVAEGERLDLAAKRLAEAIRI
jgi:tRNA dimethylallyltransferase